MTARLLVLLGAAAGLAAGCAASSGAAPAPSEDIAIPPAPPPAFSQPDPTPPVASAPGPLAEPTTTVPITVEPPRPSDPGAVARAELLFVDAKKAMAAGDTARACALFEASMQQDPAMGTMLNLGDCREQLGQTREACRWYRAAERAARDRSDARVEVVKQRASALNCPP